MKKINTKEKKILEYIRKSGVISPKEMVKKGISRHHIYMLLEKGYLEKVERGLYRIKGENHQQNESLIAVSKKFPKGTICLLTALKFHGVTVQNPHRIWVAIHNKAKVPVTDLPVKVIRMSGFSFIAGREDEIVENNTVRIYNLAKTIVDCFKFRGTVGIDVAIEALREYIDKQMGSLDELWDYAEIDRMQKIITPYIEAMK